MKKSLLCGIALIGTFASTAQAATIPVKVSQVAIEDRTKVFNDTSGLKNLIISFTAPVTYCGSSGVTSVTVASTYTSEWAHWVRLAEAALLSGKTLVIDTHATTTTNCRPFRLSLGS